MPKYRVLAYNNYSRSFKAVDEFECPAKEVKAKFDMWMLTESQKVLSYFSADSFELVKVEAVKSYR